MPHFGHFPVLSPAKSLLISICICVFVTLYLYHQQKVQCEFAASPVRIQLRQLSPCWLEPSSSCPANHPFFTLCPPSRAPEGELGWKEAESFFRSLPTIWGFPLAISSVCIQWAYYLAIELKPKGLSKLNLVQLCQQWNASQTWTHHRASGEPDPKYLPMVIMGPTIDELLPHCPSPHSFLI